MSQADESTTSSLPSMRTGVPGPASRELLARLERHECPAFAKRRADRSALSGDEVASIVLERGLGTNLWDVDGNRYVDLAAGFGSVLLGHAAPPISNAIAHQTERLTQGLGDLYASDVKVALIERLALLHPAEGARVLLCQSGADAITAGMKTAMLATSKPGVIAFGGAYHGLGYAPLAACGFRSSYRDAFASQLSSHVRFVDYPRTDAGSDRALTAAKRILSGGEVGAILIEPVLGRGGVVVPPAGFLASLATLAQEHGALVIADEIWTGLGRSGAMSLMQSAGAPFDILCLGKGLGGSLSISACIASDAVMHAWARDGEVVHTSTHAGAPLACSAALALLDELEASRLCERSRAVGGRFLEDLTARLRGHRDVVDVRGAGLMIGIELVTGELGLRMLRALLTRGFIATSGGKAHEVVVLTPPLVIEEVQLSAFAEAFQNLLTEDARAS